MDHGTPGGAVLAGARAARGRHWLELMSAARRAGRRLSEVVEQQQRGAVRVAQLDVAERASSGRRRPAAECGTSPTIEIELARKDVVAAHAARVVAVQPTIIEAAAPARARRRAVPRDRRVVARPRDDVRPRELDVVLEVREEVAGGAASCASRAVEAAVREGEHPRVVIWRVCRGGNCASETPEQLARAPAARSIEQRLDGVVGGMRQGRGRSPSESASPSDGRATTSRPDRVRWRCANVGRVVRGGWRRARAARRRRAMRDTTTRRWRTSAAR